MSMAESLQQAVGERLLLGVKERMAAIQAKYTPAYYREQLPELEELQVTDDMILNSKNALYERIRQKQDCTGCAGYTSCRRGSGLEGTVIQLAVHRPEPDSDDRAYIADTQRMCDPYRQHLKELRWNELQQFSGKAAQDGAFTFPLFPTEPKKRNKDVCAAMYEFANEYKPGDATKGIYLYGKAGTYKTFLLLSLVNRLEERRVPVLFVRTDAIFRNFKGYLNRREPIDPIIETYATVPVLAVDEFAQESATEFTIEVMFEIINARFTNGLPTFYTSNYAPDRIYQKAVQKLNLEEKVEAIRRRIAQGSRLAQMTGETWRDRDVEHIGSVN